tara:strand:- start:1168 stop:1701 length:534 start_codon:yes stop_codon:yes gene_type:complete
MSSYQNRNHSRQRSRESLDRKMDKWIRTGKQVVDGVAGNRPGQRRGGGWQEKTHGPNFDKVGRWMEEKIDWFFEDDENWLDNEDLDDDFLPESKTNRKRPLAAISLRAPKALPPRIDEKVNNSDEINEWPDDQSFKLNKWERKDNLIKKNQPELIDSSQNERSSRRRNLPKSNRRKY